MQGLLNYLILLVFISLLILISLAKKFFKKFIFN